MSAVASAAVISGPGDLVLEPIVVKKPHRNRGAYIFLTIAAIFWLTPVVWTLYTSFRPYSDTAKRGYVSLPGKLSTKNYTDAWTKANFLKFYKNSFIITVPSVILTLLLASMVAFVVSRFSYKFNLILLMLFTAGNLLPQQVLVTPLFRLYKAIPVPWFLANDRSVGMFNTYFGVIAIHVAFQCGFCTFVLSNFMKALPIELNEAARVDGASVFRQYWQVVMPLCRPALGALATLEFTWIFNDFLWALVLMQGDERRPITSALANLRGVFFKDNNLIAAGAMLAAIPTIAVYIALQKQFIGGLTLGANKG
jgi:multiple sugar transport system permease protein